MSENSESAMTRECFTCTESETVQQAAQLMSQHNVGFIPVVDSQRHVKGVVTDRDLTLRVLSKGKGGDTLLKSVMSTNPLVTVRPEDSLQTAEERMIKNGSGRALVTDQQGRLMGVISRSNIASHESTQRTGEVLGALTRGRRQSARSAS
jgi:CBS domain-containing protein